MSNAKNVKAPMWKKRCLPLPLNQEQNLWALAKKHLEEPVLDAQAQAVAHVEVNIGSEKAAY